MAVGIGSGAVRLDDVTQVRPDQVIHHHVRDVLAPDADVDDARDVLVLELRADPGLALESLLEVVAHAALGAVAEELERDPLAQVDVRRLHHHAHRAPAEHLIDPVLAVDHRADRELREDLAALVVRVEGGGRRLAHDARLRSLPRLHLAAAADTLALRLLLRVGLIVDRVARVRRVRRHGHSILRRDAYA